MARCAMLLGVLFLVLQSGCMDAMEEQTEAKGSIIGKKTQKVGEFDPNDKTKELSDSQGTYSNPLTGAAEMYVPTVEKISKMHIEAALKLYHAEHGRYPESHEEFMEKIIKPGIRLPKLPADREYQYDVENHKLVVVVKVPPEEDEKEKKE